MYNAEIINSLVSSIKSNEGKGDKDYLTDIVVKQFNLQKPSKGAAVFYCDYFAIRFCEAKGKTDSVSNTVMKFLFCKNYDSIPVLVCAVGPKQNFIHLANATFIQKVSHSSLNLRVDNIVGSINYPNIMKEYEGIPNEPENFEKLFMIHSQIEFDKNLIRIVEATKEINPTGKKFTPTEEQKRIILEAPERAYDFIISNAYEELKDSLDKKTELATPDIQLIERQYSHDVKLRGNLVEYFIKSTDEKHKKELREKIKNKKVIEDLVVENGLGDYSVQKDGYSIEIDIKSKVKKLNSEPKGYNVDKLLEFLSDPTSIYLLYIVVINGEEKPQTELSSIFQKQIMEKTRIQHHWSGRNSRGCAQFEGHSLEYVIEDSNVRIEIEEAKNFLKKLLDELERDDE